MLNALLLVAFVIDIVRYVCNVSEYNTLAMLKICDIWIHLFWHALIRSSSDVYSSSIELSEYYATVQISIGTPSQDFDVLLDTTNNETWVFNDTASVDSSQSKFMSGKSSTFSSSGGPFYYTYQNGSTNGTEGVDTIVIGETYNMTNEKFGLGRYDDQFFIDGMWHMCFVFLISFYILKSLLLFFFCF